MKRKLSMIILTLTLALCSILGLAACGENEPPAPKYYTVTWQNYDGSILETDANVKEGLVPTYDSATPTKESDAEFTYEFSGWSPEIKVVDGDITYIAQFSSVKNKYTVTWKDYDGTVLEIDDNVEYGTTPFYDKENPTREKDAQYTYTFSGWNPTVDLVTGNVVYTAQYSTTLNKYTVTWKNYDGTILETDTEVPYGTIPSYNSHTPTKDKDAQYTYAFNGWDKTISAIVGDITYTARYTDLLNKYTVTWKDYDGTVLELDESVEYGTIPTYNGATPTRERAEYTYTFIDWDEIVTEVTGNVVYTAQYSQETSKFTVVWKNYDGTVLKTDTDLLYQETPEYVGQTPTRAKDAQYTYTFSGWSPAISKITDDVVYTAQYSTTLNKYTVTWKNYDGTVLETDAEVSYGTIPSYNGNTPTKEKDVQYTYIFNGWDKTVSAVTGDVTFTAKFNNTVNKYTITWKNYDGTVLKTDSVAYGSKPSYTGNTPTKQADAQYSYLFSAWTPNIVSVTGDAEYIAKFTQTTQKYTVIWKNYDGTVLETDNNVAYGTVPTYNGSMPNKPYDSLNEYEFEGWSPKIEGITGNTIYTALFSINDATTFIVKYDANGGTGAPSSQTKDKGQNITLSSTIPTNGEHVFIGWDCAYDGNTYSKGSSFNLDANVTLYAVWGHGCKTCGASGQLSNTKTCDNCSGRGTIIKYGYFPCTSCGGSGKGSVYSKPCSKCSGIGAYRGENGQTHLCSSCMGTGSIAAVSTCSYCSGSGEIYRDVISDCSSCTNGSITIYTTCGTCNGLKNIKNTAQSHTLTLKNGSSTFATKTVYYGDSFKLNIPIKTGYAFIGWFDAQKNGKQYTDRSGVSLKVWDETSNKTLYAQWIENYTITYNLDGGTVSNPTNYNIETSTFKLNNPTKTGYTFIGWTGSNGDKLDLDTVISTGTTGDLHFIANWSVNQYTLSFVAKNGQSFDSITQDFNTAITLPKPTWTERSFVGWFDESLTVQFTSTTMPAENVTLYAKWINYEVSLCVDNLTGLGVNSDLTDGSMYGVTAIDTDNNPVSVKAQLISGSQTAGTYITVRFVATGLHGVYATQMIGDIKVYGIPTITYNTEKDYMNESDSLGASLFTATATDAFGESLFLNVSIKETGFKPGDTITIILSATDVVGNTTVVEIDDVKYYGTPTIVRDESVTEMKISDTISNEFFGVSATDSFGEVLTVNTVQYSGSFVGGNTITIKSSVTDSKGNSAYITYNVKVYGLPTITSASKTNFKEGEEINLSTLGIIVKDSFGKVLKNVTLSLTDGTNAAGNTLTYIVIATDHLGNENTKEISVKIYGVPSIAYDLTKNTIKSTDSISPELLSATAQDSFGNSLGVTATIESGEIKGGSLITIKLVATDRGGNTCSVVTDEIKVYAQEDIALTYNAALSNNIKKTSCGEEFNAIATDSFGEECLINVVPANGYSLTGGTTINLYLVATDKLGNTYTSELITEKNVYDTPTLSFNREYKYMTASDNPYTLFSVKDSFGAERLFDVEVVSGSLQEVGTIVYRFMAEDKLGNKLDCLYETSVIDYDNNGCLIWQEGSEKILLDVQKSQEIIVSDGVTKILQSAFSKCDIITNLVLPNSVTNIEEGVFDGCEIKKAKIPIWAYACIPNKIKTLIITSDGSVTSIGNSAFSGFSLLESIELPNNITSIGNDAFYGCPIENATIPTIAISYIPKTKLKTVVITSGESIGNSAFENCKSLTSVTIGDSVTSIGNSAFLYCYKLVEVINKSSHINVTKGSSDNGYVGYYAVSIFNSNDTYVNKFSRDNNGYIIYTDEEDKILVNYVGEETELTLPSDITEIHKYAFYYNDNITSVTIGNSVTSIGDYAFNSCSSLTSVTIGDSVTRIGSFAFEDCTSLTSVTIESGSIGDYAFYNCTSLTSVTIGDSVTSIGSYAFYNCSSLTSVTIGDSVTSIGSYAFYNCSSLTSVTIGDSVTRIGSFAFEDCTSLTEIKYNAIKCADLSGYNVVFYNAGKYRGGIMVTIGKAVKKIPAHLFFSSYTSNSPKITEVIFEEGSVCESIGSSAFYHCTSLTSVVIPNSVKNIGSSAFYHCTSLTSVVIPNSVKNIGSYAFYECRSLTSITIPDSVTSIGDSAFYHCKSLTSVDIGNSVTSIGDSAFYHCTSLTSVDIGNSVTSIGDSAFEDCTLLTSVDIGNSVTSIGDSAFDECRSLRSITIPNSVKNIGSSAFNSCTHLTSVVIPNSVTSIGAYAFYYCSSLTRVYYKGSASQWNSIDIDSNDNSKLTSATRYYYIENEADVPNDNGNYWHYDENGEIAIW